MKREERRQLLAWLHELRQLPQRRDLLRELEPNGPPPRREPKPEEVQQNRKIVRESKLP